MQRRHFLKMTAAGAVYWPLSTCLASLAQAAVPADVPAAMRAQEALGRHADSLATPAGWRRFEVTTQVSLLEDLGGRSARVWLPLPLASAHEYQQLLSLEVASNGQWRLGQDAHYQAGMLNVDWPAQLKQTPQLSVVSQLLTRDRATLPGAAPATLAQPELTAAERALWLSATELLPTDGIVLETARRIVQPLPAGADEAMRARAIYDWVVEHTFRDPQTQGCGLGDVRYMLENQALGGKCADINAVFVALARAAGIPARDVYGIRLAPSRQGHRSLGARNSDISRAQHCRAEFHLAGQGWIPVDPADVRKLMLEEEPQGLALEDAHVRELREFLFGHWEMNWMAYNHAHDLVLPGSSLGAAGRVGFLMYPQGETAQGRLDPLDPEHFRYSIQVRELT